MGALHTIARCLRGRGLFPVLLATAFVVAGASRAETTSERPRIPIEYHVKAAFLLNFTKYVKWPERAFEKDASPLVVAVVGEDPFGRVLDETMAGTSLGTHPLEVRRFRDLDQLGPCHLLFVPPGESARVSKIVAHYAGTSTLLVGDPQHFTRSGGVIRFFIEKRKVRFEINTDAARRTQVEISSQLLKLARLVTDEKR